MPKRGGKKEEKAPREFDPNKAKPGSFVTVRGFKGEVKGCDSKGEGVELWVWIPKDQKKANQKAKESYKKSKE